MRLQKNTLTPFEKFTGISANQISAYLRGDAAMSKARSLLFETACKKLGYKFAASDWMFHPEQIRQELMNKNKTETTEAA